MPEQVIVIGAGPVGLVTALGLGQRGIDVRVLERETGIINSPRAMVYHWAVLDGLEELGLLDDIESEGFTRTEFGFRVHRTGESIVLNLLGLPPEVRHPYFVHLGQHQLAEIVVRHLERMDNVTIEWGTQVHGVASDSNGVDIDITRPDGRQGKLRADWVVGSDGGRSVVRKSLGIDFEGMTWPQVFVAHNVWFDFEPLGYVESNYLIDPEYGSVVSKITKQGLWRLTYQESATLSQREIRARMPERFEAIAGVAGLEVERNSIYKMHQRAAARFREGRVVLAGDAAHVTNPTSGFGLVSGLFDAYVLAEALAAVVNDGADDEVLDRYAAERRRVFWDVTSPVSVKSKTLVFDTSDPDELERKLAELRRAATNRDLDVDKMGAGRMLATPSLVENPDLGADFAVSG